MLSSSTEYVVSDAVNIDTSSVYVINALRDSFLDHDSSALANSSTCARVRPFMHQHAVYFEVCLTVGII